MYSLSPLQKNIIFSSERHNLLSADLSGTSSSEIKYVFSSTPTQQITQAFG